MADEAVAKIGTLLEQLNARFELVVEAVAGFGGQLNDLRDEVITQFAEVGKQFQYLCDQVAVNRDALTSLRGEVTAELVRLGEALGATRVELRDDLVGIRHLREQLAEANSQLHADLNAARVEVKEGLSNAITELRREAPARTQRGAAVPAADFKRELAASAVTISQELRGDFKQTSKALAELRKKFDRFDDRVTIEVKDHDQRIRKLERSRARG